MYDALKRACEWVTHLAFVIWDVNQGFICYRCEVSGWVKRVYFLIELYSLMVTKEDQPSPANF